MKSARSASNNPSKEPPADLVEQIDRFNRQIAELHQRRHYQQAYGVAMQALYLAEQYPGWQHPTLAITLNNLAAVHKAVGHYAEAERFYLQALQMKRATLGEEHSEVAQSMNNLADLYESADDYAAALQFRQQALRIRRTALGEHHPKVAASLVRIAWLYNSMRKYGEAEQFYQEALRVGRVALGEDHLNLTYGLDGLAQLYLVTGNYGAAEPLYHQSLEIKRKALGEFHPDYATALSDLAVLYSEMGKYTQAEPLSRQALDIRRTNFGDKHPAVAQSISNLAGILDGAGKYAEAEPLYHDGLRMRRELLGDRHPDVGNTLNNMAYMYRQMGRYADAEPLYREALDIMYPTLGETHPHYIRSVRNLASLYTSMANYAKAEPLYQQALTLGRTALGERHPDSVDNLSSLAHMYYQMGNYVLAEETYQQVLEIKRVVWGESHPEVASTLSDLGNLYRLMGNYAKAKPLLQQALEIRRAADGERHPNFATVLNSLGQLYAAMGNYAKAGALLRQALEIRGEAYSFHHLDVANSMNNLAEVYRAVASSGSSEQMQEQAGELFANAEQLYRHARDIVSDIRGETHPDLAFVLNNLALLYHRTGRYEEAESLYHQVSDIWRVAFGETNTYFALSLNNLAGLYHAMGNYVRAEELYQQANEAWRASIGETHPEFANNLTTHAGLCVLTGRAPEAVALLEQAAAVHDRLIGQVFAIGSERQRMEYMQSLSGTLAILLSMISQHLVHSLDTEIPQKGLLAVLRRKAIGLEALVAQRDAVLSDRYPALTVQFQRLTALRMEIAQKTLAGPGTEGIAAHEASLAILDAQREELEADLVHQIPEMNLERRLRSLSLDDVAKAVPEEAVLVEFVRFKLFRFERGAKSSASPWDAARYLVFVLPAGAPDQVQIVDLGEAEPIDQMIAAFRASVTDEVPRRHLGTESAPLDDISPSDGMELRAVVFDPLLPALNDCTRLFLAPDGDLTRLPFEVLPTADGRRLIDSYYISYLSVGRDVLRLDTAWTGRPAEPLVIADPDFDLASGVTAAKGVPDGSRGRQSRDMNRGTLRFERLQGTRVEGEQVAAMLDVVPLLAEMALEGELKARRSPRILHIATHGFFLEDQQQDSNVMWRPLGMTSPQTDGEMGQLSGPGLENPLLRSGLALAGANTWLRERTLPMQAEDGILTAEDVSGLDLLDTELVVLSACETGLGEVQVGEGVFGLRRAFVLAGAKTLVMSLWKVPDQQTQELMVDFYQRILKGQPCAEALREAKLAMKAKYPDPFYWGAFICQGDPGPLPGTHR